MNTNAWTKFPLRTTVPLIAASAVSVIGGFVISYRNFDQSVPIALMFAAGLIAFVFILLLIVKAPYRTKINLRTQEISLKGQVFPFQRIVQLQTVVSEAVGGNFQIDLLLTTDNGVSGKIPIMLPFQKTRTAEELIALHNMLPALNLPHTFQGDIEKASMNSIKQTVGSYDALRIVDTRLATLYPEIGITPQPL